MHTSSLISVFESKKSVNKSKSICHEFSSISINIGLAPTYFIAFNVAINVTLVTNTKSLFLTSESKRDK